MINLEKPGEEVKDKNTKQNLKRRISRLILDINPSLTEQETFERFPGSHPVSFTRDLLNATCQYLVCEKTDGVRYLLLIPAIPRLRGIVEVFAYLVDRKFTFWKVVLYIPGNMLSGDSLFDVELVVDYNTDIRLLVFDTLYARGMCYMLNNYYERLRAAWLELIYPIRESGTKSKNAIEIFLKDFYRTEDIDFLVNSIQTRLPHATDGIIFTRVDAPYIVGTNSNIVKWKPNNLNSVDFIIKPSQNEGIYNLFTKNLKIIEKFGEIEIIDEEQRETIKYNQNLIAECCYLEGNWIIHKIRTDKDTPNTTLVAQRVFKSISDNVTVEELIAAFKSKSLKSHKSQ